MAAYKGYCSYYCGGPFSLRSFFLIQSHIGYQSKPRFRSPRTSSQNESKVGRWNIFLEAKKGWQLHSLYILLNRLKKCSSQYLPTTQSKRILRINKAVSSLREELEKVGEIGNIPTKEINESISGKEQFSKFPPDAF